MERTIETLKLDGGCPAFDFTNTVHSRKDNFVFDYLNSYDDLLQWSAKTSLLPERRLRLLAASAAKESAKAESILRKAKVTREVLYSVFSSIAVHVQPKADLLEKFNEIMGEAMSNLNYVFENGEKVLKWPETPVNLEEPLWHVLKSVFDIWYQEDVSRIKECGSCGWLFLDKTKNKRRRWCNMQTCGSNEKALRYYYRQKEKQKK